MNNNKDESAKPQSKPNGKDEGMSVSERPFTDAVEEAMTEAPPAADLNAQRREGLLEAIREHYRRHRDRTLSKRRGIRYE